MPLPWLYVFCVLFISLISVMVFFNYMPLNVDTKNKMVKLSIMPILW